MTTLILKLTPALAKRLARGADQLTMSHEEVGTTALRLFLRHAGVGKRPKRMGGGRSVAKSPK